MTGRLFSFNGDLTILGIVLAYLAHLIIPNMTYLSFDTKEIGLFFDVVYLYVQLHGMIMHRGKDIKRAEWE